MADDAFDVGVVEVGGAGRTGQHVARVEQVEPLVLHRAHVEVVDSDDHEALEVQRQLEAGFVPGHGRHQRVHRMVRAVQVAAAHPDLQQVLAAQARADALLAHHQVGGDHREQVRRLRVRILPDGEVAPAVEFALFDEVAVGQQHRVLRLVGAHRDRVDRHHVRTVEEVGDAPEALRFALRVEAATADVQARQFRVLDGCAGVADLEHETGPVDRQVVDVQQPGFLAEADALAIGHDPQHGDRLAIQHQGLGGHVRIALDAHAAGDQGLGGVEVERQLDLADPERRWLVVPTVDECGGAFTHGCVLAGCADPGPGSPGPWRRGWGSR